MIDARQRIHANGITAQLVHLACGNANRVNAFLVGRTHRSTSATVLGVGPRIDAAPATLDLIEGATHDTRPPYATLAAATADPTGTTVRGVASGVHADTAAEKG